MSPGPTALPAAAHPDRVAQDAIRRVVRGARFRERHVLLETEAMAVLEAAGIEVPARVEFADAAAAERLHDPPLASGSARVVLKALAPHLLHKTELGAVRVLPNRRDAVVAEARAMARRLGERPLAGFVLCALVPHEAGVGREFLFGLHFTPDFGPVVLVGAGGVHAELLGRAFRPEESFAVFAPGLDDRADLAARLAPLAAARLATESQRGAPPAVPIETLVGIVRRFLVLAGALCPDPIADLEVNPLVVSDGRLVALDALVTLGRPGAPNPAPRPLERIARLLEPRSIAVAGVSRTPNPGRIILENVLRAGFDPARVTVIKPGEETVAGCRCVPNLAALEAPVDLLVLSVAAEQAAAMLSEATQAQRAESIVLIPGGLEEHAGGEPLVARMRAAIERSRATAWGGPVVNGGNCLGLRSHPGRVDTLFIPQPKLGVPPGEPSPLAFISGSGAFAVAKLSRLAGLNPLHTITIGNQMDLTAADYLEYLGRDERIETFAVYLEGFRPGDGARFLQLASELTRRGRTVILYRGGRTAAGAAAAASHTASLAGDDTLLRRLAPAAGVVLADTLEDFEDLVRLFVALRGRTATGNSLGAVTNAGFESVAIADNLGALRLATWAPGTAAEITRVLAAARLDGVVSVRDPLDLTPILDAAGYEAVLRAVLADPGVDVAVVGCVPLTGALETLAPAATHGEDFARETAIVPRLLRVWRESRKPWVAVVDAGRLYEPMARMLEDGGVPTFRTADRAMRALGAWVARQPRRG